MEMADHPFNWHPQKTLKMRAVEIANHAHNPRPGDGDFLRGLDERERQCMRPLRCPSDGGPTAGR